ncbi:hypothetical protein J6590_014325 [Homalodisca vitripennis]|nr:hypothetical protein J6590_014325 [Homalodisca vitripennis]
MEIAQLKARQNNFDTVIRNFSSWPQSHCSNIPHQSVLYEQGTQTETTPEQVAVPNSPSGVIYTPETIKKVPPIRNLSCSKPHGSNKRRKSATETKTNQFSVALQVKKNKIL